MRSTESERLLVIKQLRRAREEVIRAKLMMEAIADDEDDTETVEDLAAMSDSLGGHIDAIVKAKHVDEDEEDSED
jgi:hypothetical protein